MCPPPTTTRAKCAGICTSIISVSTHKKRLIALLQGLQATANRRALVPGWPESDTGSDVNSSQRARSLWYQMQCVDHTWFAWWQLSSHSWSTA